MGLNLDNEVSLFPRIRSRMQSFPFLTRFMEILQVFIFGVLPNKQTNQKQPRRRGDLKEGLRDPTCRLRFVAKPEWKAARIESGDVRLAGDELRAAAA